jgi:hypothetical protein
MAREIWPYRRAPDASVEFSPWLIVGDPDPLDLPDYLEGWDAQTDVNVERVVRSDLNALRMATGLDESAEIILTVSWVNRQSFMTERLYRSPLDSEQNVRVTLPANRLGGSIEIVTTVSVALTDQSRPLGVARWAGSVLMSDVKLVVLEGNAPMLPIMSVDFSTTPYSAEASWALQLPEDLSLPVLGSVLLLVNALDRELESALSAIRPDPRQSALIEELASSLGARLITEAASRQNEIEAEEWPDQSTGSLLQRYLDVAETRGVLSAIRTGDPALISANTVGAARAEGFGRRLL